MRRTIRNFASPVLFCFLTFLATSGMAQQAADQIAPEAKTTDAQRAVETVKAQKWMVAIANPWAAKAAADILRKGGTAADAAVTAQLVLGLVEPQSSGIGGGAFLVYRDGKTGQLTTLDGRETAPGAATPRLFQSENGEPLKFFDAVIGGRSVGVPGVPDLLGSMHKRWGKSPWSSLVQPAIDLAVNGTPVGKRLAGQVARDAERLSRHKDTADYFLPGGKPLAAGAILKNPAYAATLVKIRDGGSAAFYTGPIADQIVSTVRGFSTNPGLLTQQDFANYRVKERNPVCVPYRGHEVCGMGPPSSGGLTVGLILGMLDSYDLKSLGPENAESWRLIGDASRLAFADRGRYMADIDFVPMPVKGLLKPAYLKSRSQLLASDKALETVSAGQPEWDHARLWADDTALELPSTTHFSIIDSQGNSVSVTSSIENGFGSRLMSGGFLLNNQLTDFSFKSHADGVPIANRVEPGKRPRSSMSPTIVLKDGKPIMIVGSPGGSRIIGYVAKTIIAHLDWGMNIQEAISSPHLVNRFGIFDLEDGTAAATLAPALEKLGYEVNLRDLNSGLHAIIIKADGSLEGGADPRREGIVIGE